MKTVYAIIALACVLCCHCLAAPPDTGLVIGPVTLNITGTSQNLYYSQVSAKTNVVGSVTNFTLVSKSTTTNFSANNQWLLALLENSFHTNFPAGSQLQWNSEQIVVADSTGTNLFFPYPVLTQDSPVELPSGTDSYTGTNVFGEFATNGNISELFTRRANINYNDSAMTNTTDRTHTQFRWVAFEVNKYSDNFANGFITQNITMKVIGSGSIRGQPPAIFTGTIHAKASGIPADD